MVTKRSLPPTVETLMPALSDDCPLRWLTAKPKCWSLVIFGDFMVIPINNTCYLPEMQCNVYLAQWSEEVRQCTICVLRVRRKQEMHLLILNKRVDRIHIQKLCATHVCLYTYARIMRDAYVYYVTCKVNYYDEKCRICIVCSYYDEKCRICVVCRMPPMYCVACVSCVALVRKYFYADIVRLCVVICNTIFLYTCVL